jgi:allantoin racemase
MIGWARSVQEDLPDRGCEVPVIEPGAIAAKTAEALLDMGLSHSKRSYPTPREKVVIGYP